MSIHHPDHQPYRHFATRQRVDQAMRTLEGMAARGSRMADRSPLPAPRSSLSLRPHLYRLRNVSLRGLTQVTSKPASHLRSNKTQKQWNVSLERTPQLKQNNMKTTLPYLVTAISIISSCAPIKDAADMRTQMAGKIAPGEGLRTVWNTSTPLTLGYVYYKKNDASKGGYVLSSRYDRFVDTTNSPAYCLVSKSHASWRKEINTSFSIKPQLTYMGLGVNPSYSNTKKITFTATGDEVREIKQFDSYVSDVLNAPGTGPELRQNVYDDTRRLEDNQLPVSEARYWIVTNMLTMKDLSVDFTSTPKTGIEVSVADIDALKQFLQVNGLAVSGKGEATSESKNHSTINATDSMGVIAWCVPLTAKKVYGKIVMKAEEDHPIPVANTLR